MVEKTSEQIRDSICEITGWTPPPPLSTLCGWSRGGVKMLSDPLSDLNACEELIDFLKAKGWWCEMSNIEGRWRVAFRHHKGGHGSFIARDDTLPVAICRAFVATMEQKEQGIPGDV